MNVVRKQEQYNEILIREIDIDKAKNDAKIKFKKRNKKLKKLKILSYLKQSFSFFLLIGATFFIVFMFKPFIDLNYNINKVQNDIYIIKKDINSIDIQIEQYQKEIENFISLDSLEKYAVEELNMIKSSDLNRIIINTIDADNIDSANIYDVDGVNKSNNNIVLDK